jgi:hypothetical protein
MATHSPEADIQSANTSQSSLGDQDSMGRNKAVDITYGSPRLFMNANGGGFSAEFVPPTHFTSSSALLTPTSPTSRAKTCAIKNGVTTSVVHTYQRHGPLPNGGPPIVTLGYFRTERGTTVIHNLGRGRQEGRSIDLGPANSVGEEHTEECRKNSRMSDSQGICQCPPTEYETDSDQQKFDGLQYIQTASL